MNQDMKRNIILEHYQNPVNRGLIDDDSYIKTNTNNESCIDEIDLMAKVEDNRIKDIRFDGEACAICTSSASIMTEIVKGKEIEEVKKKIQNFTNMINESEYDSSILEEAIVYEDVCKQPSRKKCALLPWWGLEKIVEEVEHGKKKN